MADLCAPLLCGHAYLDVDPRGKSRRSQPLIRTNNISQDPINLSHPIPYAQAVRPYRAISQGMSLGAINQRHAFHVMRALASFEL